MYRNSNENIQDDQMNYAKAYKPTRITSFTVCSVSYAGELSHFSLSSTCNFSQLSTLLSGIPRNAVRVSCIFLLYTQTFRKVSTVNTLANRINAAQDGRVGCNIIESTCTEAFLYLDWVYCPWHGTNFLTCLSNQTILPDTA